MNVKKLVKHIVSVLLGAVICFGYVGCNTDDVQATVKTTYAGNHVYTAPETTEYLLQDGTTEYSLVIPSGSFSNTIMLAVEEFNNLFKKATGITLPLVYDNQVAQYAETAKFISLGDTTLVEQANVSYDKTQLKTDGCRIITKGKTVFLLGASDYGVLNAVYDFMQICFHYEFYARDCIEIDSGVRNLKLRAFDVTDVPDTAIRASINGNNTGTAHDSPRVTDYYAFGDSAAVDAKNRTLRYRFNDGYFGAILPIYSEFDNTNSESGTIHNAFNYVTAQQAQKGWYALSGSQLCYSASSHTDHFDEANFDALADFCARKIENSLKLYPRDSYPQYNTVTLTQTDAGGFCSCKTCLAWQEQDNGAVSGGMIRLNNAIIKKVKAWMALPENEPYKRDDLKLLLFSYNTSEPCPVVFNEATNSYEPANEEVRMEEGTGVYFAAMQSFEYIYPFYHEANSLGRERIKQWTSLSDYCWLWVYGALHTRPMFFIDTYNFHNEDAYQYFAAYGFEKIFDENIDYSSELTGFNSLKAYVESKLLWDSSLDQNVLIEKYMNAMFKDAADEMYDLFVDYRVHFAYISEKIDYIEGNYKLVNSTDNYAPADFLRWIGYIDTALEKIEKYKTTDSNLYYLLKDRIEMESACPLYCMLSLYGDTRGTPPFSTEERVGYIQRLTEIATKYPTLTYETYTSVLSFVQGLS